MLRDLPRMGSRVWHDEAIFMSGAPGQGNAHDDADHQSTVDPLDDVFGSAPPSPNILAHDGVRRSGVERVEHSDIPRLRSIHVTNGYREGIAASKEQHIQAGFDEGYSLGGEIGTKAGWFLGLLDGIYTAAKKLAKNTRTEGTDALVQRIQTMHKEGQSELKIEKLLSAEFFGSDGIWLYDVPGQDASDQELHVTFRDVATVHPVIKEWETRIVELTKELGLHMVS